MQLWNNDRATQGQTPAPGVQLHVRDTEDEDGHGPDGKREGQSQPGCNPSAQRQVCQTDGASKLPGALKSRHLQKPGLRLQGHPRSARQDRVRLPEARRLPAQL